MLRMMKLAFVVVLVAMAADAQAAPIRVAVEDGTGRGGGAAAVVQLNNDTFFDFSATLVNASQIDSAAELSAFDVVVIGGSGFNDADWTTAMTSALRTFVVNGGGVVGTGWINFDIRGGDPTAPDLEFLLSGQNTPSVNQFRSPGTLNFLGAHPVTSGLANFSTGASFTEVNRFVAEGNDTVLANMVGSPNDISVAVKNNLGLGGRSVYLGPIYLASVTQYNTAPLRSGSSDQLFEQAVAWASGGGTTVVPEPTSLTLLGIGVAGLFGYGWRRRKTVPTAG